MLKKKTLVRILLSFLIALSLLAIPTTYYSLKYMNWYVKSQGYPGLYEQENYYQLISANSDLVENANWSEISSDESNDGDIPNWSDVKTLSTLLYQDTLWVKYELYNNIDINEPMVSLALDIDGDPNNGKDWYGTTSDFNYDIIITAGYTRVGEHYKGYNFAGDIGGQSVLSYHFATNCYFLGIPNDIIKEYEDSRFVASVGNKGLWNDDVDGVNRF